MTWVVNNLDLILRLTVEHLRLSFPPIIIGFLISIPLGWLAYRFKLTAGCCSRSPGCSTRSRRSRCS